MESNISLQAFFDEIEDLKYNHNEMTKLVDRYEALLMQLSSRYGFEFTPQVRSLLLAPLTRHSSFQTTAKRGGRT